MNMGDDIGWLSGDYMELPWLGCSSLCISGSLYFYENPLKALLVCFHFLVSEWSEGSIHICLVLHVVLVWFPQLDIHDWHHFGDGMDTFPQRLHKKNTEVMDKMYPFTFMFYSVGYLIIMLVDLIITWVYQKQDGLKIIAIPL